MQDLELIVEGFYAHYACQFVICSFIALLLARLSAWQSQALTKWWAISWAGLAGYIACAGIGLWLVMTGRPPEDPYRIAIGSGSMAFALIQLWTFIRGWVSERLGQETFHLRSVALTAALIFAGALPAGIFLHTQVTGDTRFFFKVTLRGVLLAAAYFWVGVGVLRYRRLIPMIRIWLGLGLLAFGLKHTHYTYSTIRGEVSRFREEYLLQFIELGLHTVIAAPMLLWVCLSFVLRTNNQAVELGRQQDLLRRQEQLLAQRQRLSSIGRMAAGIAHDFNNILSVIQSWTDIMRHESRLDDSGKEGVDAIETAAQQAGEISKKLMLFGGNRLISPEPVDAGVMAREAVNLAHGLRTRRVEIEVEEELSTVVHVDRPLLLVSIQNLLINAIDATEEGGRIRVRVHRERISRAFAQLHELEPGPFVQIEVVDDGVGIPEEALNQVFEPFFTTKAHGNGLGLASVHGFAQQSNGTIEIQTNPKQGTAVSIWLPLREEAAPNEEQSAAPPRADDPPGARVLVVDDEAAIARHLAGIIRRGGYEVTSVTSPDEALEVAKSLGSELRLLVTDVRMPEISGAELAQRILATNSDVHVIFVTGYADDVAPEELGARQLPAVLQKPVRAEELLSEIEAHLSARRALSPGGLGSEEP